MPSLSSFPDASIYELENGLCFLHQKSPKAIWGKACLWIKIEESKESESLGHLLEHLLIQKKRSEYKEILIEGKTNAHFIIFQCDFLQQDSPRAYQALLEILCHGSLWNQEEIHNALLVLQYEKLQNPNAPVPDEKDLAKRLSLFQKKVFQPQNALLCLSSPEKDISCVESSWQKISQGISYKNSIPMNKSIPFFKALALNSVYDQSIELVWESEKDKDFLIFLMPDSDWVGYSALFPDMEDAAAWKQKGFSLRESKNSALAYRIFTRESFASFQQYPKSRNPLKDGGSLAKKKLWFRLCNAFLEEKKIREKPLFSLAMEGDKKDLLWRAKKIASSGEIEEKATDDKSQNPETSAVVYVMAGSKAPGLLSKDYFSCHALAVLLSQEMSSYFVDSGQAYQAISWYDPIQEILCVWVATTYEQKDTIKKNLDHFLLSFPKISSDQWSYLLPRTRLCYLKSKEFTPQNFPDIALELAMIQELQGDLPLRWKQFQNADFICSHEDFIALQDRILKVENWIFLDSSE